MLNIIAGIYGMLGILFGVLYTVFPNGEDSETDRSIRKSSLVMILVGILSLLAVFWPLWGPGILVIACVNVLWMALTIFYGIFLIRMKPKDWVYIALVALYIVTGVITTIRLFSIY